MVNATTWPVEASHWTCFSKSGTAGNSDLSQQGFSTTNFQAAASSGMAWAASNSLCSMPVTNSCPRASFTRKKFILRWWKAPRSAKHIA